jgi:TonB family protein
VAADEVAARSGGWRRVDWLGVRRGGAFSWNGSPAARPRLARLLAAAAGPRPQPAIVLLRAPGAPCAALAEAAALVEIGRPCRPALSILSAGADRRRALLPTRPPPPEQPRPSRPPPEPLPPGLASRARATLSAYLSNDDYPATALRAEEQGVTSYALDVGADGRVARCTILGSSGSAALDAATCRIMTSRARFVPARNLAGEPVPDRITARITWTLPDDAPEAAGPLLPAIGAEPEPDPPPPPG